MALIYISLSICCISIHYIQLKSVSFFFFLFFFFFIESLLRSRRSQWIFMDTLTIWNIKCVQSYSLGCKNGANVSISLRISWSRRSTGSRVFQELDWFSVATGCTCTAGKVVMSLFYTKSQICVLLHTQYQRRRNCKTEALFPHLLLTFYSLFVSSCPLLDFYFQRQEDRPILFSVFSRSLLQIHVRFRVNYTICHF